MIVPFPYHCLLLPLFTGQSILHSLQQKLINFESNFADILYPTGMFYGETLYVLFHGLCQNIVEPLLALNNAEIWASIAGYKFMICLLIVQANVNDREFGNDPLPGCVFYNA